MENNMKEMNIEELEKINGGTNKEYTAFVRHLMDKYGVMKHHAAYAWATPEEKEYWEYVKNHRAEDGPLKPYPDA